MRLKPLIQHCVMAGLLALPIAGWSVGLGKLTLQSGLGQPLAAEIELTSVQPGELESLTARLADQRTYAQNRVDFGSALSRVRVAVERRGSGPVLKVSSAQPINEPFLDLLIELNWNTGRLLREYTFLLDPPGFTQTTSVEPAPAIPQQPVAAAPAPAPRSSLTEVPSAPAGTPPPAAAAPSPPVAPPAAGARAASATGDTYGPVKRGETLGKIAAQVKPDSASLEQMLTALYRANTNAFDGNNMNRLKTGGTLRVPKADEVNSISKSDALKEIRVQAADWRGYRDRLAGAAATSEGEGVRSVAGARITTAGDTLAAAGPATDRLLLSKAEAAGAGGGGSSTSAARAENAAASQKALADANARVVDLEKQVRDLQRLLELKNSALQAQQAAAEQAAKGGAAKSAATAATAAAGSMATPVASPPPTASTPATAAATPATPSTGSAPATASTSSTQPTPAAATPPAAGTQSIAPATPTPSAPVKSPEPTQDALKAAADAAKEAALADSAKAEAAKAEKAQAAAAAKAEAEAAKAEAAKAKLKPPATQREPSFLDDALEHPYALVGGGAALGLALVALLLARRRRSTAAKFEDSIGAGTDIRTSTVFGNTGGGVVNTGDNSLVSDFSREGLGNIDTGEVDPIAEAEVYLAYGRDNQAEEILKDALNKTPDRQEIRLKLLEIYAQQNKPAAFEAVAKEINAATSGSGDVWAKAALLGRGIDPANPLYAAKGESAAAPAQPVAAAEPPVDPQAKVVAAVEKLAEETNLEIPESPKKEVFVIPPALTLPETQSGPMTTSGPATLSAPLAAAAAASVAAAAAPQASAMHERAPLDFKLDSPPEPAPVGTAPAMDFVTLDGPITLTGATTLSGPSTLAGVTLASPSVDIWGEKPLAGVSDKIEVTPGAPGDDDKVRDLHPADIKSPAVAAAVASGAASMSGFAPMTTSTVTRAPQPAGKLDLDKLDLSFDPSRRVTDDPTPSVLDGQWHDAATKLDLAKAYQEMGDVDGAREILQEVMQEGDDAQKQEAQTFLKRLRA